jgi:hypothetical protein
VGGKNINVFVCNIIIVALAVVSVITLFVGNFLSIKLTFHIDGDNISELIGNGGTASGTNASARVYGENEGGISTDDAASAAADIIKGIKIDIPFTLEFKSSTLIKSVIGDRSDAVEELIGEELDVFAADLLSTVDEIMGVVTGSLISAAVAAAKQEVTEQLREQFGNSEVTEEEVMSELESEYGVTEDNVNDFRQELTDAVVATLNGQSADAVSVIENSETFDKILRLYAEQTLNENSEEGAENPSDSQISEETERLRGQIIDNYNQLVDDMSVNGEFSKETVVVGLLNQAEPTDENGNKVTLTDMTDVKKYISDKIYGSVDGHEEQIGGIMQSVGIFILAAIASWLYVVLKIIFKLFAKNKTVRLFMPRFFGWMPHVFFVGIPMTAVRCVNPIADFAGNYIGQDAATKIKQLLSMVTVDISSLTWVSAVCSVILLFIAIPYYRRRREIKRRLKYGGREERY